MLAYLALTQDEACSLWQLVARKLRDENWQRFPIGDDELEDLARIKQTLETLMYQQGWSLPSVL